MTIQETLLETTTLPTEPALSSGIDILSFLKDKEISTLNLAERQTVSHLLSKQNFSNNLSLPEIPLPNSRQYQFIEEILTTHTVYATNKLADEAWMAAMVSQNPAEFKPALAHLNLINAQVNQYQAEIATAGFYLDQPNNVEILQTVRKKYQQADSRLPQGAPMIDRVANRILQFPGQQGSADLDLTITENADYFPLLPHAMQFENFMHQNGREVLPFLMARYAKEALLLLEPIYEKIGSTIPLRPGVKEFCQLTQKLGIPVSILSANFLAIISGCLTQIPKGDRKHFITVTGLKTNSILASHKDITTAQRILANPDLANFLFLDGLSDQSCLEGPAAGTSAAIFVLKNTQFAKVVKQSGQPYFEFADFNDNNKTIVQILQRKAELQESAKI